MHNPRTNNERTVACRFFKAAFAGLWTLQLFSATAVQIASFSDGGGGWQLGTIAVGNIDGSPDLEIVVPYRDSSGSWFLDAFKYNGTRLRGFPY